MSCNCNGKTYKIGMGCCEPVLAPIENYYTRYEVDKLIESATTSACCITEEEVDEKIASAKTEIEAEIPTVPTSNTAFTNDAGYLTSHQPLKTINGESLVGEGNIEIVGGSGVTSGDVQIMIEESVSGKQDTLSAGTNISIVNNVISADDTTYTAGDGIAISNQNVISTITKFWCGTEQEWSLISGNTDANTIYLIH